jgi:hypothetical protein
MQWMLEAQANEVSAAEAEQLGDTFEGAAGSDICEKTIRDEERPMVAGPDDDVFKVGVHGETGVRRDGPRGCRPDDGADAWGCI